MIGKTWIVYKHINKINSKIYIGITSTSVQDRWSNGAGYKTCHYFNNAIEKYGWDNFEHQIIVDGLQEKQAKQLETELIIKYDSINSKFGYNLTFGGEGNIPGEETRKKLSKALSGCKNPMFGRSGVLAPSYGKRGKDSHMWGKHHTDAAKKKISDANKGENNSNYGKLNSVETRKKISIANSGVNHPNYGKHRSEETRSKIGRAGELHHAYGTHASEETKKKMSASRSGEKNYLARKVVCLNNGEIFGTITAACVKYGISCATDIRNCCIGKNHYRGIHPITREKLRWMYHEDYLKLNNMNASA